MTARRLLFSLRPFCPGRGGAAWGEVLPTIPGTHLGLQESPWSPITPSKEHSLTLWLSWATGMLPRVVVQRYPHSFIK